MPLTRAAGYRKLKKVSLSLRRSPMVHAAATLAAPSLETLEAQLDVTNAWG
jgi:hypothetical protein